MFRPCPVRLFLTALYALVFPAALRAQGTYTSVPVRGLEVVVSDPGWRMQAPGRANLVFNWRLQHPDGTDVPSEAPMAPSAVQISGWSLDNFDANITHAGMLLPGPSPSQLRATVPGLDPHSAAAHLEFDIRDPNATSQQSGVATSTMTFNAVPVPTAAETPEPVNFTYTTSWGTEVTMTAITARPAVNGGNGAMRYQFTVDHSSVPDDQVIVRLTNALDGGVPIDGASQLRGRGSGPNGAISTSAGLIDGTVHKSVTLVFEVDETSISQGLSTAWLPVEVSVPLAGLPAPVSTAVAAASTTFTIDGAKFIAQNVAGGAKGVPSYLFYISPSDPKSRWRLIDVATPGTSAPSSYPSLPNQGVMHFQQNPAGFSEEVSVLTNDVNCHLDGTPLAANETGSRFHSFGPLVQPGPLQITAAPIVHHQQIYTFSDVAIPDSGDYSLVDRHPDGAAESDLVLHAIRNVPWSGPAQRRDPTNVPYTLSLEFVYTGATGSINNLVLLTARDDENNALKSVEQGTAPLSVDPLLAGANKSVFVVQTSLPPHDSKTLHMNIIATQDVPTAPAVHLTLDSAGAWAQTP